MRIAPLLTASLLLVPVLFQGCTYAIGAAAGVGTVLYVKGDLETAREESLDEVYAASIEAMEDLEFTVKEEQKDALQGKIEAEMADGKNVKIKVKTTKEGTTSLSIRVGLFGDEELSRLILEEIEGNL